ncbi:putative tRNA pseudouridine synthase 1 [Cocos nucifera]|uniref:tRNA pseudouridine(55) synthase n=1 Tax=Cocos nucifera TaxID=13894 RepID=A0A8K0MX12_COCNU|nr:putative tRNA pseudouridine synthase 1 [Cocos nucifera]
MLMTSRILSSFLFPELLPFLFLKSHRFPPVSFRPLSTTATPYPLYYELIRHRPVRSPPRHHPQPATGNDQPTAAAADDDEKLMDRSKRRYYRKRRQRMFGGSDTDDDGRRRSQGDDFVELKPEVVDFPRLHAREEELYFYDTFAYPWEKEKHYRMVYQLEKKYFPEHSLDKAFVDPGTEPVQAAAADGERKKGRKSKKKKDEAEGRDEKGLVFFDEEVKDRPAAASSGAELTSRGVTERKVEEFFKCLKKVPNARGQKPVAKEVVEDGGEPYLVSRKTELPPRWNGPSGTVVLVDKPKGWTSFTVCGKLRRLVKVQKVGHAGTLDPMATGLLIVCVGKATKIVDRYQGMIKGYSGVFRLGEATSTWDADSPVRDIKVNGKFSIRSFEGSLVM